MPKSLRSLDDHTQDTLDARRRSRAGRFQATPPGTERVADVVTESCATVAKAFESQGFRWAKSGLRFSRKVDSFTHIVSFQSDAANTSGAHIAVAMHAQVKSSALAKWRTLNGATASSNVWISQIGYLSPAHEYLKWQLVDPVTRVAEIASMVAVVRDLALPAFEVCSSTQALSQQLLQRSEITWTPHWAADIALWVGNRAAAEAIVQRFLSSSPGEMPLFFSEYERLRAHPSDVKPLGHARSLAWLCAKHSLAITPAE
jgi:hypothetical protein